MIGIDIPMPPKCDECRMRAIAIAYCQIAGKSTSHYNTGRPMDESKRPDWCPLIDLSQYEDDGK